ncbi:MAG TPA: DUF4998 domain-containing protein [Sphingobacteriaceae bacterium]
MKSNNFITASISAMIMLFTLLGCAKMDDTYSEFVKDGEKIYIAKADSIKVRGGNKRIQLSWLLLSDPKVVKYKVLWNNGRDSIVNPVTKTASVDTIILMINNIEEGTHQFEIYTYDKLGNTSVKATTIGKVYGDRYGKSLLSATYSELVRDGNDLKIVWAQQSAGFAGLSVKYQDSNNNTKEIAVNKSEAFTILQNLPFGGEFKLKTAFLPDSTALDTFYTSYNTIKPRIDTVVNWKNYRAIFGHFSSIIMIGNGQNFNTNIHRTLFEDGRYQPPAQIGGNWNGLDNVCTRGTYLIAQLTGSKGVPRRYNYNHSTGTFPGPNPNITGTYNWENTDQFFIFQNDIMIRNKTSGKLTRRYLNSTATAVTKSVDIVSAESWNKYDKLIGCRSWIFATTPDGKVWRIAISTADVAGVPVLVGQGWDKYFALSLSSDKILGRTSDGELWEIPVDANGNLGQPDDIWVVKEF